jgi:citrate synthase
VKFSLSLSHARPLAATIGAGAAIAGPAADARHHRAAVADIRKLYGDLGVFTYDPGYGGTAACDSKITYIDGDEASCCIAATRSSSSPRKSTFLEVCYLLLNGELPNRRRSQGIRPWRDAAHHAA